MIFPAEEPHPIAKIEYREDAVVFSLAEINQRLASRSQFDQRIAQVIQKLLANGTRTENAAYQVFLLSGPDDPQTVRLAHPIVNDTTAKSGKAWAWTLGQRYTRLAYLKQSPATTTQLDALAAES